MRICTHLDLCVFAEHLLSRVGVGTVSRGLVANESGGGSWSNGAVGVAKAESDMRSFSKEGEWRNSSSSSSRRKTAKDGTLGMDGTFVE